MTVTAFAVLEGVPAAKAFVAARCAIMVGNEMLHGRAFLAHRRGEVAACIAVDCDRQFGGRYLDDLARAGRLSARCETEDYNGLTVVQRIQLCFNTLANSGAWCNGQGAWALRDSARAWYASVTVSAMATGSRATLPAPSSERPHANHTVEIDIHGDIGYGRWTADKVIARMGDPDRVPGNILVSLDSAGGAFEDGRRIYQALASWPCAVYARIRRAQSAAALIALGADIRTISPEGNMLLHPVHIEFTDGYYEVDDLLALSRQMLDHTKELVGIVALATGVPVAIAEQWCAAETEFDAGAAFDAGLVHDVRAEDVPAEPRPLRAKVASINGPFRASRPMTGVS